MPATDALPPVSTHVPDTLGAYGPYGGKFVPETLMDALDKLAAAYEEAKADPAFWARMNDYLTNYVGRPSPLTFAERLSKSAGGADLYLKREDLNHTGAHKINNAIGQVLIARAWARRGSSPRPAPASTASPRPPPAP